MKKLQEFHTWQKTMIHQVHCNTSHVQQIHQDVLLCLESQHKIDGAANAKLLPVGVASKELPCPMGYYVRKATIAARTGIEKAAEIHW